MIKNKFFERLGWSFMRLIKMSRRRKQIIMLLADAFAISLLSFASSWVLFAAVLSAPEYWLISGLAVFVTLGLGLFLGLYIAIIRYVGLDFYHRAILTAASSAFLVPIIAVSLQANLEIAKWGVLYAALMMVYFCQGRYWARAILLRSAANSGHGTNLDRVLVYGAGAAGSQLVECLLAAGKTKPVAIVDDDKRLRGTVFKGIKVFGSADVAHLVATKNISRILLALPSASRRRRSEILTTLEAFPVHVQTVPDFQELLSGNAQVDEIRDIDLADLMGRSAVPPNPKLMNACILGKTVFVSGAGGSVGLELCKKIARCSPSRLVLLEISESALYSVDKALREIREAEGIELDIVPLLGSVCDSSRIENILRTYEVETIYHAAAYKHVPMVEHNMLEGIRNNSLGTLSLALAAMNAQVESFVLVSTDKAVRPTNIMGASKRLAEMILQALQVNSRHTRFSMVRFGNVLDSSGSVVPLFREQITHGGPVTVTHPEIIRYFMTIPEAAELVIQAGSEAKGGDVFVLDMGEPIKIVDLAKRMIFLLGHTLRDTSHPT
ncbi:MAG: nucleoside-diphosphate sugar epimerase/dehydratase, partial [Gammaproteobacteria bacterium]|nr:nucleoside-diphosphate sugar epimerase/dehydratase [Gammaproteobacteria bacterium]